MSNMLTIDAAEFINVIYLLAGYKSDASRLQKLFENMQICLRGNVILLIAVKVDWIHLYCNSCFKTVIMSFRITLKWHRYH
jgi:hypothetical protein